MGGKVLVGTSGWADQEGFYPEALPEKERLSFYATAFPLVELDATFYHPQPRRTTTAWAERVPDGFVFDVKAWKLLTRHVRVEIPTEENFASFSKTLDPLRERGRFGALHFQFPPWFQNTDESRAYLAAIPGRFPGDRVAVEFRHRSWLDEAHAAGTLGLLRASGLAYCVADEPQLGTGSVPPVVGATHPELAIVRLHGRNPRTWYARGVNAAERGNYRYGDDELREWMDSVRTIAAETRAVHVLFANKYAGYAVENARRFAELASDAGLDVAPAPAQGVQTG